jgi:pilus assembly protein CpaF
MKEHFEVGVDLKERVRRRLLEERDQALFDGSPVERRLWLREAVRRALEEERVVLPGAQVAALVREISDEVVGLGPIEALLRNPRITEVMINGPEEVYVERDGRIRRADVTLESDVRSST